MKPVEGFPGYFLDNDGYFYTKKRRKPGPLKTKLEKTGYHTVGFWLDGKKHTFWAHRIIAKNLIPNPENKPCVNHKDNNKINNHPNNLEWSTQLENMAHCVKQNRTFHPHGELQGSSKLKEQDVKQIRYMLDLGYTLKYISELYGVVFQTVSSIKLRRSWKHI